MSSSTRKGVVAGKDVLEEHGAESFEEVQESGLSTSGIKHRGWTFA